METCSSDVREALAWGMLRIVSRRRVRRQCACRCMGRELREKVDALKLFKRDRMEGLTESKDSIVSETFSLRKKDTQRQTCEILSECFAHQRNDDTSLCQSWGLDHNFHLDPVRGSKGYSDAQETVSVLETQRAKKA